ncbi:MAG: hypothetical protein ACOYOH_28715, partial [Paracraurococcus sp.]
METAMRWVWALAVLAMAGCAADPPPGRVTVGSLWHACGAAFRAAEFIDCAKNGDNPEYKWTPGAVWLFQRIELLKPAVGAPEFRQHLQQKMMLELAERAVDIDQSPQYTGRGGGYIGGGGGYTGLAPAPAPAAY